MAVPQINFINNSDNDLLHIAIYQKLDGGPSQTVAWRVISLCAGSTAYVPTPNQYAVQIRYSHGGASYRTRCAPIDGYRGAFLVTGEENCIKLTEVPDQAPNEGVVVKSDQNVEFPVGTYALLAGDPVYGPAYINRATMVGFRFRPGLFYAAKVDAGLDNGSFLDAEALTATEVQIRPNQTVIATGNQESGYSLNVKEGLDTAEC